MIIPEEYKSVPTCKEAENSFVQYDVMEPPGPPEFEPLFNQNDYLSVEEDGDLKPAAVTSKSTGRNYTCSNAHSKLISHSSNNSKITRETWGAAIRREMKLLEKRKQVMMRMTCLETIPPKKIRTRNWLKYEPKREPRIIGKYVIGDTKEERKKSKEERKK